MTGTRQDEGPSMKKTITRRQFVGGALAAGAFASAPALLRGQNLNSKMNIAVIGVGGRGGASVSGVRSENIVAMCDVNAVTLDTVAPKYPQAKRFTDLRRRVRQARRLRRGHREHVRAHARVRHDAGAAGRQARLLREAARLQHLGDAAHPRDGREAEGRDADGDSDPRRRQLPPGRGARAERGDRPGPRSARLGQPRVGTAERGGREAQRRPRLHARPARRRPSRCRRGSTGICGWDRPRRGRSTPSTSPGPSGIAGGISAAAR